MLAAWPALAQVELHLTFGVLQKVIAAQVFTDQGRKYVKGSKDKRCSFAYLENPRVGEADGRLLVRAKFSGRSAWDEHEDVDDAWGVCDGSLLVVATTRRVEFE